MKTLTMALVAIATILFLRPLEAHEGPHDPSGVEAPRGGVMRSLETVHLELVNDKDNIKIYLYSKDLKPAPVKGIPLSATISLPREKPMPFSLVDKGNYWEGTYKGKETHRYTITLDLRQGGQKHKVTYTVERKK